MNKIGIIGAETPLGLALGNFLRGRGMEPTGFATAEMPVNAPGNFAAAARDCGVLINCVEVPADSDVDLMRSLNVVLPGRLAEAAAANRCYAVHVSTAQVFEGREFTGRTARRYRADEDTFSIQPYARTRLNGEKAFLLWGGAAALVRPGTLLDEFTPQLAAARRDAPIAASSRFFETPVSRDRLLLLLAWLAVQRRSGIFQLEGGKCLSRFELAKLIAADSRSIVTDTATAETPMRSCALSPTPLDPRVLPKPDWTADFERWKTTMVTP